MSAGITIVGLGPSSAEYLTRKAWEVLTAAKDLYVRTSEHPALDALPPSVEIHAFDKYYDQEESFELVYDRIVEEILTLASKDGGVVYAVPGDPGVGESTVLRLRVMAKEQGIPFECISGVSFVEPCLALLEIDALDGLSVADALQLGGAHHPSFPPDRAAFVAQLHSQWVAADVKLVLLNQYPADHQVSLISNASAPDACVEVYPLEEMDRASHYDLTTTLFVPPVDGDGSFEAFQELVAHLRAPEGCPWDREQTHETLRSHLMEEAFEALEAIDNDDMQALKEELGDLLLQIVLQTQIATEQGSFQMIDVIQHIREKLIRRHPHVFTEMEIAEVDAVLHNWEALKEEERDHQGSDQGLLDGVPRGLPALAQADEMQARVARVGFDWPEISGVVGKVEEEIEELSAAKTDEERAFEMGDLLFSMVNYARWLKIDPEAALRQANDRFRRRFHAVETRARESKVRLADLSIEELETLWQESKAEDDS